MNITNAQYILGMDGNICGVKVVIDGENLSVPLKLDNRHYAEIMRQVDEGSLTIAEAE